MTPPPDGAEPERETMTDRDKPKQNRDQQGPRTSLLKRSTAGRRLVEDGFKIYPADDDPTERRQKRKTDPGKAPASQEQPPAQKNA